MSTITTSTFNGKPGTAVRVPEQTSAMPDVAAQDGQHPLPPSVKSGGLNSGMTVPSVTALGPVRKVDQRDLRPGGIDYRSRDKDTVKEAMDLIANPPGPRQQMRGQQDSRNYNENGKAFRSSSAGLDSDAKD